jgi:hypothetical protein
MDSITRTQPASLAGLQVYPASLAATGDSLFFMAQAENHRRLGILTQRHNVLDCFIGERGERG